MAAPHGNGGHDGNGVAPSPFPHMPAVPVFAVAAETPLDQMNESRVDRRIADVDGMISLSEVVTNLQDTLFDLRVGAVKC